MAHRPLLVGGGPLRPVRALLVLTTLLLVGTEELAASPRQVQAAAEHETVLRAIPVSEPPRLDGVLDEPLWQDAPLFDRFLQQVPDEGKPATERTEVRIVYTRDKLYFGVMVFYSDPNKMIANELRYDQARMYAQDDTFSIMLDTFHDHRNGYLFLINALGTRNEWACTEEGRHWNRYWDPVWDVATRVGPDGWSAEVEIPFKSLRYDGESGEWGINLRRAILYKNEWVHATLIPPGYNHPSQGIGKLSSAAVLEGLDGITESRNLEFKPFVTAAAVETDVEIPGVVPSSDIQPGIDIKYGFTPNLNLDLTVNTDFSHVEVDQQQINLTRFGLFFPEKRAFFQEGQGIFDFGQGRGNYRVLPFFSRRIGLEDGRPVPIRAGARLTGKLGPYSLGLLGMRTKDAGLYPATSFSALRLKRDVLQRSSLGLLFTDRRPTGPVNSSANQVAGLDANFAFFAKSKVDLFWARSNQDGPGQSSTSYRAHLLLESDLLGLETDWMQVGDTFSPEVGFVQRDDMDRRYLGLQVSPRPGRWGMRKVYFRSSVDYVENLRGLLETRHLASGIEIEFDNADELSGNWVCSYEALEQPFLVAGLLAVAPGEYRFDHWNARFVSSQHRNVSATVDLRGGGFFDGTRRDLGAATKLKVNQHLFFDLDYSTSDIRLLAGDLRTHLAGLRSSVALNTRLFGAAVVQWNSVSREFGVNVRLRYTYRPGSDFYIVFNERMTRPGDLWFLNERSLTVKWTYLFQV